MLAAPSGAAGFITRHHTAVLSVVAAFTGIVTAAASASAWVQTIVWTDLATLVLGALLAAAVAYRQTRHPIFALLVALTPLPGLVWAAPLSAGSAFGLVPVIAYGFGFALAMLYAQHVLDRVLREAANEAPWRAGGVMLALAPVLALVWFFRTDGGDAALQAVGDLIGTSASVLLLLPLAVPLLHFDEAFVASANRARERRGRICEWLGGAALPRWGFSLTGIALIFLALGWFGAEATLRESWWRYGVSAILVCGGLGFFAGGWREGLGLGLTMALTGVIALWWRSYDARFAFGAVNVLELAIFAGFLALAASRRMRHWRLGGDPSETVRRRGLEDASGAVYAAAGATAAALPALIHTGAQAIVLAVPVAGLCGALLLPILLTALEMLVPRRRSVEDVFVKRRR